MPLISKGEKITCTNGHVIGEALDDVNAGDLNWGAKFGNWTQDAHPEIARIEIPPCKTCGAKYIKLSPGPYMGVWKIHFEDGTWR